MGWELRLLMTGRVGWLGGMGVDRHSTDREIALMVLMAYLSYLLAEVGGGMGGWEWGKQFSGWGGCARNVYNTMMCSMNSR